MVEETGVLILAASTAQGQAYWLSDSEGPSWEREQKAETTGSEIAAIWPVSEGSGWQREDTVSASHSFGSATTACSASAPRTPHPFLAVDCPLTPRPDVHSILPPLLLELRIQSDCPRGSALCLVRTESRVSSWFSRLRSWEQRR